MAKKTKPSELRSLNADELELKVVALKKELMQFRFQAKTGKLERQSAIRDTKRDIARMLTIINEKTHAEASS